MKRGKAEAEGVEDRMGPPKRLPSNPQTVTLRDVARRSGFSSSTVSIVLNDAPLARYIPPATKSRIQQAARELGYRPNVFARSLRGQRSNTVGVMVFDMTDPYCTMILRGIENSLYKASYLPILSDVHNERSRFEGYLEMMLERHVEGLIVVANWLFVDIHLLADMKRSRIPRVMIGIEPEADFISSVTLDNELGARLALDHLLSLGHRKLAFVRGPKGLGDSEPRWHGIQKAAKARGVELDPRLVVDLPDSRDPMSSFEAGHKLTEQLLGLKRAFTALMAFDDMSAFGAIRALSRAGVRVPDQCSVIGFDDVAPAALATPALTTIRQPGEAMGTAAVRILLDGIRALQDKKDFRAVRQKLVPELVVRESTRPVT